MWCCSTGKREDFGQFIDVFILYISRRFSMKKLLAICAVGMFLFAWAGFSEAMMCDKGMGKGMGMRTSIRCLRNSNRSDLMRNRWVR